MGQPGQFADYLADTVAEQPPGIPVRQDGNLSVGTENPGLPSF